MLVGSAWSLCLQVISRGSVLVTMLFAARLLEVKDFGFFVSLQAIGLLSAGLWDLGYSAMITRDLAAKEEQLAVLIRSGLRARLRILPGWLLVFAVGCTAVGVRSGELLLVAAIIGAASLATGLSTLLNAGLQGSLRFGMSALTMSSGRLITASAALTIGLLHPPAPMIAFAFAYLLGELSTLVTLLIVLKSSIRLASHSSRSNSNQGESDILRALPYALNSFFTMVYNRMDVVLVTFFAGGFQAGIYAPASRIQDALTLMPVAASAAVMPLASARYGSRDNSVPVRRIGLAALVLSLGLTVPAIGAAFVFADPVIPAMLGSGYEGSIGTARVIIWSVAFIALAQPWFALVVAAGGARQLNLAYGIGLVVAIVGHAVFDPQFGAVGAAWVAVIRDAIVCTVGIVISLRLLRTSSALGYTTRPAEK